MRLYWLRPSAGPPIRAFMRLTVLLSLNVLVGFIKFLVLGGEPGSRTLWPYYYDLRISNPLHYHPARSPLLLLYTQHAIVSTIIWWTVPGSNRGLRLAKPLCSQLYQQPIFLASREGLEPPQTVLETAMLPLHHRDKFQHTVANVCIKTDCMLRE